MSIINKKIYEKKGVIKSWLKLKYLLDPEKKIFEIFGDKLKYIRMLDIGVGGGRTTIHFADRVKEYIGIDYSAGMIETCNRRFIKNNWRHVSFRLCDVRDMRIFKENYFNLVLFSYNGLDYINHQDRIIALNEINRILKKDGVIFFSAHNILYTKVVFSLNQIKPSVNPFKFIFRLVRYFYKCFCYKFYNKNISNISELDHAILVDEAHNFRMKTYYIQPVEQVKQLIDLCYKDIRVFLLNGEEVSIESSLNLISDHCLYFFAKKVSHSSIKV